MALRVPAHRRTTGGMGAGLQILSPDRSFFNSKKPSAAYF
jgi:hypothetical protein